MNNTTAIFTIVFCIVLIVAGPLVTIWSLNTLFPMLAIPYSFWTWLAIIMLGGAIKSKNLPGKKQE